MGSSQTPGNELVERFSSRAANQKGSDNLAGVRDPAVDALIGRVLRSGTREELVTASRALDRVLRNGWYLVPHFHVARHRVAYRKTLEHPETLPLYYSASNWVVKTWWRKPETDKP